MAKPEAVSSPEFGETLPVPGRWTEQERMFYVINPVSRVPSAGWLVVVTGVPSVKGSQCR